MKKTFVFKAEEAIASVSFAARETVVRKVAPANEKSTPLTFVHMKAEGKLVVFLPRIYGKGEEFALEITASEPDFIRPADGAVISI